jgi:hypothetical protein
MWLNSAIIREHLIGNDFEEISRRPIKILSLNLPEGLKKTIKFLSLDSRCAGHSGHAV